MSPLPVRVEMNASDFPSGEKSGRESYAGCATSKCASPPPAGAVQMSPPETKATVLPSGDSEGSKSAGSASAAKVIERASAVKIERMAAHYRRRRAAGRHRSPLHAACSGFVTPRKKESGRPARPGRRAGCPLSSANGEKDEGGCPYYSRQPRLQASQHRRSGLGTLLHFFRSGTKSSRNTSPPPT